MYRVTVVVYFFPPLCKIKILYITIHIIILTHKKSEVKISIRRSLLVDIVFLFYLNHASLFSILPVIN